jgi:hypothetical protein
MHQGTPDASSGQGRAPGNADSGSERAEPSAPSLGLVDVRQVVAWWAENYLSGDMTGTNLVSALQDLRDNNQAALSGSDAPRLSALIQKTHQTLGDPLEREKVETLMSDFLGALPSKVLEGQGAPDWRL